MINAAVEACEAKHPETYSGCVDALAALDGVLDAAREGRNKDGT